MPALSRRSAPGTERSPTEARLVTAALELLSEGGSFIDLKIEAIAAKAGVGRTAFYAHFADKRALLMRMASLAVEPVIAQVDETVGGRPSGPEGVREGMTLVLHAVEENAEAFRAVAEAATYDDVIADFWEKVLVRLADAAAARIEQAGQPAGAPPPPALASALVAMVVESAHQHISRRGRVDRGTLIDTLTYAWVRAVYGDRPASP